jgi:hypothetical protein
MSIQNDTMSCKDQAPKVEADDKQSIQGSDSEDDCPDFGEMPRPVYGDRNVWSGEDWRYEDIRRPAPRPNNGKCWFRAVPITQNLIG